MSALHPLGWKIGVATRGLRVDPSAAALVPADADAVHLVLADELRVRALLHPAGGTSPYVLVAEDGRLVLRDARNGDDHIVVRPTPVPRFASRTTTRGLPMSRIATLHGSHLVVHPAPSCGYSTAGAPCRFCLEGARGPADPGLAVGVPDVVDVVRAALDEGVADAVCFNGAAFEVDDGGFAGLAPFVEGVRRHFDTLVAVQMHPPRDLRWIERAYAMGVDALSFSLEIFDPELFARHCIGRARYIGRERYFEGLARAAAVFPSGTVWSELVLGLEPLPSTIAGVDALASRGVVPVVAVGRTRVPALDVEPDALAPVLEQLFRSARQHGVRMGWIRDLALGITPLEARFAAGDDARLAVAVQQLTRSRVGALAARGLARFRRRLRVRSAADASDAGHA